MSTVNLSEMLIVALSVVVLAGSGAASAGEAALGSLLGSEPGSEKGIVWESGTCEARYECFSSLWVVCEGTQDCVVGDRWVECDGRRYECPPPEPCTVSVPCYDGSQISCSGQYYCFEEPWAWVNCDGRYKHCPWGPEGS